MLVHTASLKFKPDADAAVVAAYLKAMGTLADRIPGFLESTSGVNQSPHAGGFTHAVFFRAESREAVAAYQRTELYAEVNRVLPEILDSATAVDLEI